MGAAEDDAEVCAEGVLYEPHNSLSCSVVSRGFCMNMQNEELVIRDMMMVGVVG